MKASTYLALERLLILTVGLELDGSLEAAQVANNIATELLEDIVPDPDARSGHRDPVPERAGIPEHPRV